jgi:hypothetical protein
MPSIKRLVAAGIAGGLVLNVIDTPWSVLVMVPRLESFTEAHRLVASPLAGPWFLLVHVALAAAMAWIYALARLHHGAGRRTALLVGAVMLLVNRAFGLGNVLIGVMPLDIFAGFSISFVVGVLAASLASAAVVDRGEVGGHA